MAKTQDDIYLEDAENGVDFSWFDGYDDNGEKVS